MWGGNCELFAHAITLARGYQLPTVRSSELYADTRATEHVSPNDLDALQTGDIIGMRRSGKQGMRGVHMGVVYRGDQGLHVAHNLVEMGHVVVESLSNATTRPSHEQVVWAKRPKLVEFNSRLHHPADLHRLGLGMLAT